MLTDYPYQVSCARKLYLLSIPFPLLSLALNLVAFYYGGLVSPATCSVGVGVTTAVSFALLAAAAAWIVYRAYTPLELLKIYVISMIPFVIGATIASIGTNATGCTSVSFTVGMGTTGALLAAYSLIAFSMYVCCTDAYLEVAPVSVRGGGYGSVF